MFKFKSIITLLAVLLMMSATNTSALAEQKIGLVDMEKILTNYDKAKTAQTELQNNQKELQKMLSEARKQIENAKSETDKEKLQNEIAERIMKKSNAFKESFSKKWEVVENNVLSTVKQVAEQGNYSLIMEKQSVIAGGEDITGKVLSALKNK